MSENDYDSKRHCKLTEAAQKQMNSPTAYQEFNFHCKKLQELFYDVLGAHNESSALCEGYEKLSSKCQALETRNDQLAEQLRNCEHKLMREREAAEKSACKTLKDVDVSLNDLLQELGVEFDTDASPIEKVGYVKETFTAYQKEINNRNDDIEELEDQLREERRRATKDEQHAQLMDGLLTSSGEKDGEISNLRKQVAHMERKLQETRCFTEELRAYKEDVERYRDAYARAVAEKDLLVKKYDDEQQKWSVEAIRMQDEIENAKQKNAETATFGIYKSKKQARIEELERNLEFKTEDYKRLSLQFGRYRSEKEKELLSNEEEIATLKQTCDSLRMCKREEMSGADAAKMKNIYDILTEKEAQVIELKSQKQKLQEQYTDESAHWQRVVDAERGALADLQERHAALLKDHDDQLKAKEAYILHLREELRHYKLLYETMVAGMTGTGMQHPVEPTEQPTHPVQARRGRSTFDLRTTGIPPHQVQMSPLYSRRPTDL
ncbi:synaptonemal complex protein 1-like isoform X2 [Ornithodoros turicata]|uniref:synaptonemal complex protein 1-like isoform X2 n=1 Tax=Ornithodoros turicata TaxID=34597 RepID=UPI00313910C3